MNDQQIREFIRDILEYVEEAKNEVHDEFIGGKLLAYNEILSRLQIFLIPDEDKFGNEFDIDDYILNGRRQTALSA
jgi:hypothetical protein